MRFYEKAREKRPSIHDPLVRPRRLAVIKSATVNLFLFQILFLGLFCYIFGSLFQQTTHIHNINILFVDYDGGAVGAAVRAAYQQLKAPGFPTLIERPAQVYPQPNIIKGAICDIEYWAALYTVSNASSRLTAALAGGAAASSYDKGEALAMVWNEARYPTVVDSVVKNSLTSLSGAARIAYANAGGQQLIQSLNASDSTARAVFANPWTLTSIDLQPTPQGSRLIYNTLVIILILMQDFCYLGCVNGLYQQFRLYTAVTPHRITIVRQIISVLYTFLGALCTAGAIWAFRSGWDVNGNQFVLTWMSLWLFGHLNFLVLDFFTVWVAPAFVPMALISWVMLNVTSILLPFELSPGFYRWGHALPAHCIFQILIDIWSSGCNPQLDYALPVLFAYEMLGLILSLIGVYRRAHYACIKQEEVEKACQERVAAAITEKQKARLGSFDTHPLTESEEWPGVEREERIGLQRHDAVAAIGNKEDVVDIIRREISRPGIERTATSRQSTGPAFDLPYSVK